MKTFMQLKFVVAFVMVAAIVGCAKEQSSFSVSDVKDEAKITGLITYDAGVELNGDEYQRLVKSAANVDVVVSVECSQYKAGATGVTTFETTTDAEGRYEITIPVTKSGIKASVRAYDFVAKHYSVEGIEDGDPVIEDKDCVYTFAAKDLNGILPNDVKICDGRYTYNKGEDIVVYDKLSEFQVKVVAPKYSKVTDELDNTSIKRRFEAASDVAIEIEVAYGTNDKIKFAASTDSKGVAKFYLPTEDLNWAPKINVDATHYVVKGFTCFEKNSDNEWVKRSMDGSYELGQVENANTTVQFSDLEDRPAPVATVKMKFVAFSDEDQTVYNKMSNVATDEVEE